MQEICVLQAPPGRPLAFCHGLLGFPGARRILGEEAPGFVGPSRGSREASCIVVAPSWSVLGLSEAVPEPSFGSLGPLWIPLRALWSFLGRSWSRPGPPCSGPGVLLKLSGDVFRRRRSCVVSFSRNHAKTSKNPKGNSKNQRSPGSSGCSFGCLIGLLGFPGTPEGPPDQSLCCPGDPWGALQARRGSP